MKVFVGQSPSALRGVSKKSAEAPGEPKTDRKSSMPAEVVRHPGLESLVSHVHDADEQDAVGDARVEALKQAIADGRYQVDSSAIADALIDETARVHGIE